MSTNAAKLYEIIGVEESTLCADHLVVGRAEMNADLCDTDAPFVASDWTATDDGECFICKCGVEKARAQA